MERERIGGQAVIEGVMMRSPNAYSVAVRKPDGSVSIKQEFTTKNKKADWKKWPIVRGGFNLVDNMYLGIKTLMYASNIAYDEDEVMDDKALYLSVFFGILASVGLFIVLPTILTGFISDRVDDILALNLIEGFVRISLFVLYVYFIGKMEEINRVFQYHGAEHKTINCYENDCPLTVEEAKKYTTIHIRCGTAFMLLVMLLAVLVFSFFGWQSVIERVITRIILLPLIAGISYELIMLAGKNKESKFWRMVLVPGLWMQKLTTKEPSDDQLEIAIIALKSVLEKQNEIDETFEQGVKASAR
ncbi:MAG: DUF1385 domain-containing protein [Clostridia bacterium]